jgi:osmotically-inducible protein OsmY
MHKIIACIGVLGISACSHESAGRPTTVERADADSGRHRHHERAEVAAVSAVSNGEPPHEKVIVDEHKAVIDDHSAAKVDPVPVAVVPTAPLATPQERENAARSAGVNDTTAAEARAARNASDIEMTQRIRRAVVGDNNLTVAARNVKIATDDGRVTLRGNVRNAQERDTVESYARDVAGAGNVKNQIDVAR